MNAQIPLPTSDPSSNQGLLNSASSNSFDFSDPMPPLPEKLNRTNLSQAIAEALYEVKAQYLAVECVRLGLAPQGSDEPEPFHSKIGYIQRRTLAMEVPQLVDLAQKVVEDHETPTLVHLLNLAGGRGVDGDLKNLIFAANGPKPKIVLRDAINNIIEITENAESCLVYDRPLSDAGLMWGDLTRWWSKSEHLDRAAELHYAKAMRDRLLSSLGDNEAERFLYTEYFKLGYDVPALIPQVYLHYDPYTRRTGATLLRQRMDFLLLLPGHRRIVLELDGKQHYSEQGRAAPHLYADMVREDRRLQMAGYEVYRFGGQEFVDRVAAGTMLRHFFAQLLKLPEAADSII